MKKMTIAFTLLMLPMMIVQAATEERVMELHQAIDLRQAAFEEAKDEQDKEVQKEKHQAAREEFWEKVETLYEVEIADDQSDQAAEVSLTPVVVEPVQPVATMPNKEETMAAKNVFERAFGVIFKLFR